MSDTAHRQWHDFAAENGVSVSALLEVLSQRLLRPHEPDQPEPTTEGASGKTNSELRQMIRDARQIDAARRRRAKSS